MLEQVNHFINTYLFGYKPVFGVITLIISFTLSKFVPKLANRLFCGHSQIRLLFQGSFRTIVWIVGILISLYFFGVDISSIVTGLGLIGFGIGLALKDMVTNLISGVMIMLYSPFEKGDKVEISGYKGTVRWIDLRYTTLCQLDKMDNDDIVLIPNSTLFKETVVVKEKAGVINKYILSRPDGEQL